MKSQATSTTGIRKRSTRGTVLFLLSCLFLLPACQHQKNEGTMTPKGQMEKVIGQTSASETNVRTFKGYIVDIEEECVYPGEIRLSGDVIDTIVRLEHVPDGALYYLPGFTDAHIHIESSMMIPENFAKVAVSHGVVNAVCDPHEIANVLGVEGIDSMIENARNSRFNFYFGVPSCVPSSHLETAGATIDAAMTRELIRRDDLYFLGEMMNYPGVIHQDREVMEKIEAARQANKKIDGHAPGVKGEELAKYAAAGISTDHECSTLNEARERIAQGMKVIVREGSAARNFDALASIIGQAPEHTMLCSDDKHPDDLLKGHIDELVRRGVAKGIPVWKMLKAACLTPVRHYGLPSGMMRKGDKATFIAVNNLEDFRVMATVIGGRMVYEQAAGTDCDALAMEKNPVRLLNNFRAEAITEKDITVDTSQGGMANVIVAQDGELLTQRERIEVERLSDPDIQKIVAYNRYGNGTPKVGFIKGFRLKEGAFGATVAHDSHNIMAVGASDADLVRVINTLIEAKGGVGVSNNGTTDILPLPIAGLMSTLTAEEISEKYQALDDQVKALGCPLKAPFITLSFMALPVIPELKLTDRGLVDVNAFNFTEVIE